MINRELIEYCEQFADKQAMESLIKEVSMLKNILRKVLNTQNVLISKLKSWETQITLNFIFLRKQIKVNEEDIILLEEGFKKENEKLLKQITVNKANHFLLEIKVDELVSKVKLIGSIVGLKC